MLMYEIPKAWEYYSVSEDRVFITHSWNQQLLTLENPQLVIDSPLPEFVLAAMLVVNRGRVRVGFSQSPDVASPSIGGVVRPSESFFIPSRVGLENFRCFRDNVKDETNANDKWKEDASGPEGAAEVCIIYLRLSAVVSPFTY